jgi:protein TonB
MAVKKNPKADIKSKFSKYFEVGMILSLLIVIFGFLYFPYIKNTDQINEGSQELVDVEDIIITQQESTPPPPPKPTIPIEVPADEVLEDIEFEETELDLEKVVDAPPPPFVENIEDNEDSQPTFFIAVEEMPEPIGGVFGIQKRIVYPDIAKRAGVQGRVYIKAFVDENGDVKKTEVLRGIGAGCDEAAVEAVKNTKFKPGKQRGKPVKVQVSIPIKFVLSDNI